MPQLREPSARQVPSIPVAGEKVRILIDTDAKNEIDDQYAIALALALPERFELEGFVGANFDNERGGPDGIRKSVEEVELILEKAGMSGRWPVLHGSHPMRYREEPSESEGVDFIIDRAMASTPDDPLWVVGLGAATDIASAYLKQPAIAERIVVFWHFRTHWPEKCVNFNVFGDTRAARLVFHSPLSFVLFDTGTHLRISMDKTEQHLRPRGALGEYLHEYRKTVHHWTTTGKGFFDLGDIAALADPNLAEWEEVDCPEVHWDLTYRFTGRLGRILRCYHIDCRRTFDLLFEAMRRFG
jgi:inosine-uridine nucleoside N-ribohydrolase